MREPAPPSERSWTTVPAVLVAGYGVASGTSDKWPHTQGSIALQHPHFLQRGLDLSPYYSGTLNLQIEARAFRMVAPRYVFSAVDWLDAHPPEDFSFSPCRVEFRGSAYEGLIYYPHPSTKPAHRQPANLIEVIAQRVPDISYGDHVVLHVDSAEVDVMP